MTILNRLQEWYASQCDGEWEHSYGIKIHTLDNPGWYVEVDLPEDIAAKAWPEIDVQKSESDWHFCHKKEQKFIGAGDPAKLETILKLFLDEVEKKAGSEAENAR